MSTPLASLGSIVFQLSQAAYDTLSRTSHYRWAMASRVGRAPARQFIGEGDDQITLSGLMFPHVPGFGGDASKLEAMRAEAKKGEALLLILNTAKGAKPLGKFCIESVAQEHGNFIKDHSPRKVSFSLTLGVYGEDG